MFKDKLKQKLVDFNRSETVSFILVRLCLVTAGICIGIMITLILQQPDHTAKTQKINIDDNISKQIISNCNNESMIRSMLCVRDQFDQLYNYTVKDSIKIDLEELYDTGGDCADWSWGYKKLAEQMNYSAKREIIPINETTNHIVTIIYSNSSYCIGDLLTMECKRYKN